MTTREYRHAWRKLDPRKYEKEVERKYSEHPRLYIGYGSNLNIPQMMGRCADAKQLSAVNLLNYKLVFTDVLTVEPCKGVKVPCGLWRVSPMDIDALDVYEGYPGLYTKAYATINLEGADELAFMYVLDIEYELSTPSSYYMRTCLDGYRQWGLNEEVLRVAEAEAEDAERDMAITPMQCKFCDEVMPGGMLSWTREYGLLCYDCYDIMFPKKGVNDDQYWRNTVGEPRTSLLYDDVHPNWATCDSDELDYRPPEDRCDLDWLPGGDYMHDDMGTSTNRYERGWS